MESVLALGGAFLQTPNSGFFAPYIFMLDDIEDPFYQAVVTGENVRLREEASSKSKIISSLNWNLVDIVMLDEYTEETINGETHYWVKVKTHDGQTGFVYGKYVRTPVDYRAGFKK